MFGAGTFSAGTVTGTAGTKFAVVDGTDTMVRNGISTQVKTKHYCITGMKAYDSKSLEVGLLFVALALCIEPAPDLYMRLDVLHVNFDYSLAAAVVNDCFVVTRSSGWMTTLLV